MNIIKSLENIIRTSDFATTITLEGETFALVGNSMTDDDMIMQVDYKD